MAKLHSLKISNYRGIDNFEQTFGTSDFVCIIGRGDSGKSTILEAISIVLSSNWNLSFYDTDFYNLDIRNAIEIEAAVYDLPQKLIKDTKYGLYISGLNKQTNTIHDALENDHEPLLTIKLRVDKDLEPKWYIINKRQTSELVEMKANDRAMLSTFLVSDYIDRHFSWNKGNSLYSLLKKDESNNESTNIILEAFRKARASIDSSAFDHLQAITKRVVTSGKQFGVNLDKVTSNIDYRDISVKDSRISLHENDIPFRQKGKGSKRLLSIAIQMELLNEGGILLIDEVEQGLEPDRVKHLIRLLKSQKHGQVFLTTHSRDVIVELDCEWLYLKRREKSPMTTFDKAFQGCVRKNPEAFFSKTVIICEGATEVGICRAINSKKIEKDESSFAILGIGIVDGGGANFVQYCEKFKDAGFDVAALCDSDDSDINEKKEKLKSKDIKIFDCEDGKAIEQQIFNDLPWSEVKKIIEYAVELKGDSSIEQLIKNQYGKELPNGWKDIDLPEIRSAIGNAASFKKIKDGKVEEDKGWFKRVDHGEFLGEVLMDSHLLFSDTHLGKRITAVIDWIAK